MLFFEFPEDAHWNEERDAVEFSVILRPYEGTVRIGRRVFQQLLDQSPTPERCIAAFHLPTVRAHHRAQVAPPAADRGWDRGNTGRDLREKAQAAGQSTLFGAMAF